MTIRPNLLLATFAVAMLAALPADAATQKSKEKGVYDPVPLKNKEYSLIDTSREVEGQFQRRGKIYPDPELEAWITEIGNRLAPDPTDGYQKYRFALFRDPSPNAFALPDGQIYVHTGLLARLENEAQLAALLAHEINHVAGHHGILANRSQKNKAVASIFIGIAGAAVGAGGWGNAVAGLINQGLYMSMFGYSRALEQEADVHGYDLMIKGGYDVREMSSMFEILGQDYEGVQPRMRGKWSTHPDLVVRGQYTAEMAANTPEDVMAGLSKGDDDFRARIRPIAIATVRDYILDNFPKTALELAQQLVEEYPDDPEGLIAMGHSYIALGARSEYTVDRPLTDKEKRKQAKIRSKLTRDELAARAVESPEARANLDRNLADAEKAYLRAAELDPYAAEAYVGLGETYMRQERYQESAKALVKYLKIRPAAPDRTVVMDDLREISQKLKAEKGK